MLMTMSIIASTSFLVAAVLIAGILVYRRKLGLGWQPARMEEEFLCGVRIPIF
jgi:hypothetical protein